MLLVLLPRLELSVTPFSRIVAAPMAAAIYARSITRSRIWSFPSPQLTYFLSTIGAIQAISAVADAAPAAAVTR